MEKIAEQRLLEKGMSITRPRVAILSYLMQHHVHPNVETIYSELKEIIPNLSKTTVYNTVKALRDNGLVQTLTIDEKQVCIDEDTSFHGHLLCERCGRIIDVPAQGLTPKRTIDGHLIHEFHQYYKGVCKECLGEMGKN
ncbi:MAG: Fur family transcriptional regulator [Prevotellaceae bacterium]|nr:Fur family transcriptional regulator [Prevotellaceae bacterium]